MHNKAALNSHLTSKHNINTSGIIGSSLEPTLANLLSLLSVDLQTFAS